MGSALGVTEAQMLALADYRESEQFTDMEKLVLDLAVAMTRTPIEMSDDLRSQLLAHLSEAQLAELASAIAWENHRARLNRALGVRAVGFSDGVFCLVAERPAAV